VSTVNDGEVNPTDQPAGGGQKRLLLVVGVGRSGTSLCAGVLGQLGFRVPQPEVATDETNPRGFSEPKWVVDFHRKLMHAKQVGVFDSRPAAWQLAEEAAAPQEVYEQLKAWLAVQFVGSDDVVVKDPRIGWFLDLWLRCARELELAPATVTMLRHPTEILSSARRSYGDWQSDASRATSWINGMLGAELATRGMPRAFVRYEDLLADWHSAITSVGRELDIPSLATVQRGEHPEVDAFIDPSLQRSRKGWDEHTVPAAVEALAERVWDGLTPLAGPAAERTPPAALDALREEYARFYGEAEAIAQSSIRATKARKAPAKKAGKAAATKKAAPAAKSAASAPAGSAARRAMVVAARMVPASVRRRVPVSVRRRALRVLTTRRVR
jgi:hypothetical protein